MLEVFRTVDFIFILLKLADSARKLTKRLGKLLWECSRRRDTTVDKNIRMKLWEDQFKFDKGAFTKTCLGEGWVSQKLEMSLKVLNEVSGGLPNYFSREKFLISPPPKTSFCESSLNAFSKVLSNMSLNKD